MVVGRGLQQRLQGVGNLHARPGQRVPELFHQQAVAATVPAAAGSAVIIFFVRLVAAHQRRRGGGCKLMKQTKKKYITQHCQYSRHARVSNLEIPTKQRSGKSHYQSLHKYHM